MIMHKNVNLSSPFPRTSSYFLFMLLTNTVGRFLIGGGEVQKFKIQVDKKEKDKKRSKYIVS